MFSLEQATSMATLVNKDAPKYVANFKGEDGEDFDGDKFWETFQTDLRKARKTERDNQLMRGRKETGKSVLEKLKGLNPDFEHEGTDASEAIEAFHGGLQSKIAELSNKQPTGVTTEGLTREDILKLPEFQEAWKERATENDKKVQAALKKAADAEKSLEDEKERLILKTRGSQLKAKAIQWANQAGVNLADPVKNKALYNNQVAMFMNLPVFQPQNWKEEGEELIPIDSDGERLKTEDFHDMTGVDLVKQLNPFGFKKFDANHSSPSATSNNGGGSKMDMKAYMERRAILQEKGDRKGMAELAAQFEKSNS